MPENPRPINGGSLVPIQGLVERLLAKKILSPQQQTIIRRSYIRLLGHKRDGQADPSRESQDIAAVIAMNNSLVITPEDLQSDDRLEKLKKTGFQFSRLIHQDLRNLLALNGYAFLLEMEDENGIQTPYGCQFGFPFMPPPDKYKSLGINSVPSVYRPDFESHQEETMTIWRTSIVRAIEDVRAEFAQMGIPIAPLLLGEKLQRNRGGPATKLVDGVAAEDMGLHRVQCNIGEIMRSGNIQDMIASNELSFGSNGKLFDQLRWPRNHSDMDDLKDKNGEIVAHFAWAMLMTSPAKLIERAKEELTAKGWPIDPLVQTGHHLAEVLKDRYFEKRFGKSS